MAVVEDFWFFRRQAGLRGELAKRLSTRSVRLARMILIQAIRNAMVNDLVVRNVADLAAVNRKAPKTLTDGTIRLMNSGNGGD
jgi:hypothetical protein